MLVVINLIKKTFISMFFSFFFIELIYMVFLALIYRIPLSKNEEAIQKEITEIQGEIANSISHIVQNKFHNIMNELLLFKHHMTLIPTNNNNRQQNYDLLNEHTFAIFQEKTYSSNDEINSNINNNPIEEILKLINNDNDRDKKIETLMNDNQLNLYSKYGKCDACENKINEIEWILLYLKSVLIKNFILEGNNIPLLNYQIICEKGIILYPATSPSVITKMPFYNEECIQQNNYTKCLISATTLSEFGINLNGTLFWCPPKTIDNSLITLLCTKLEIKSSNSFLCITYNLTKTISNLYIDSPDILINLVSRSPLSNGNDSVSMFSSIYDIAKVYTKFNSEEYGEFKITGTNQHLSPFHSIYFNLEMNFDLSSKQKKELKEEYIKNFKEINSIIYDLNTNSIYKEYNKTVSFTQTFLEYGFDSKGEKNINNSKIKKATYVYFIKRILAPYVLYNKTNYLYETGDKSNILFCYVLTGARIVTPIQSNDIYIIYILKLFRNWVFFFAVLLLVLIIIYILLQYVIRWLLFPIKIFKTNIKFLIDNNNATISKTNFNYNNMKFISDNPNTNKNNKIDFEHYTNNEIKQIEQVILFLKKIIFLNNKNTSVQKRIEFYQSIASEIPKDLELDLFKCQTIIGSCFIKNYKYDLAKTELENLLKRIEHKQTELHSKYEINEMKTRNISSVLGTYINQYSQSEINDYTNWTQLLFIKENCHYLLGLVYYFHYFGSYKQQKKPKDNNNNNNNNNANNIENKKNLRKEMEHVLDNAIIHFKASYKLNEHLQINAIKNISILLYLSKCYLHNRSSKDETNKTIKKAIVMLSKFNKYIIELCSEPTLSVKVDPRIMLIVNGNLMQFILYYIAKYAQKLNKYKCTYQALDYLFHISYYKNEPLFFKAFKTLKKVNDILQEQQNWNNSNKETKSKISSSKGSVKSASSFDNDKNESSSSLKTSTIVYLKKEITKENDNTTAFNELIASLNLIEYKGNNNNNNKINKEEYMSIIMNYNKHMKQLINQERNQEIFNDLLHDNNKKENTQEKHKSFYKKFFKIKELLKAPLSIHPQDKFNALINKCYTRLSETNSIELPKALIIIIHNSFLLKFNAIRSFAILIINCINKFIGEADFLGYIYYSEGKIKDKINLNRKRIIFHQLTEKILSLKDIVNMNISKDSFNYSLMDCFDECIDMFINKAEIKCDKYIFSFAHLKDIRYPNTNSTRFQTNMINHLEISIYFFSFNTLLKNQSYINDNSNSQKNAIEHYRKFFRKFTEGFLILIENFKMIKLGFSNITFRGKQKNLFSFNLDHINNII